MSARAPCRLGPLPDRGLRPKGRLGRTLVRWLGLVALFLLVYNADSIPVVPPWAVIAAVTAIFVGVVGWGFRRGRAFNRLNDEALSLLEGGDAAGAAQRFAALARKHRGARLWHVTALQNLGVAHLRRGAADEALSVFSAVEVHPDVSAVLRFIAACELAEVFAFKSDLDAAECWLAEARRRKKAGSHHQDLVVEAVIRCQRGAFAELADWSGEQVDTVEAPEGDNSVEMLKVLRAFALFRSGAEDAEIKLRLLEGSRPKRSELDHFVAGLAGFAEFVDKFHLRR